MCLVYALNGVHTIRKKSLPLNPQQISVAEIAQLGERVTEDHKVPGSIPGFGTEHPAAYHVFLVAKSTWKSAG